MTGSRAWVVLITDGMTLEVAPEVFMDETSARRGAENWAWFLSVKGEFRIDRPYQGRLEIGQWEVRVVAATLPSNLIEPWVGMHWTEDGYADPEAAVLAGRQSALKWVQAPLFGQDPVQVDTSEWHVAATFNRGVEEEAHSVAYLAKFVGLPLS